MFSTATRAIGLTAASIGQAIFIGGGRTSIEVGTNGLSALIAYPASRPIDSLLQRLGEQPTKPAQSSRCTRSAICGHCRGANMTPLRRIAFIGNSLPRRCGIATFTTDLQQAISTSRPNLRDLHRRDDRPRSNLRLSRVGRLADQGRQHRRLCARRGLPERRPVRRRLPAARIRNFRRRSRRPHPRAAVAPHHAGRHDAAYGAGQADRGPARGHGAHRRGVVEDRRDGQQGPRAAAQRLSRAGRQDRGHRPRHSRLSVCRARRGKGQTRIRRPVRHSDLRPAVPQQGHRGHDRRHALDPETPRRTRSTSCSARRIPIWFATRARPIARA